MPVHFNTPVLFRSSNEMSNRSRDARRHLDTASLYKTPKIYTADGADCWFEYSSAHEKRSISSPSLNSLSSDDMVSIESNINVQCTTRGTKSGFRLLVSRAVLLNSVWRPPEQSDKIQT